MTVTRSSHRHSHRSRHRHRRHCRRHRCRPLQRPRQASPLWLMLEELVHVHVGLMTSEILPVHAVVCHRCTQCYSCSPSNSIHDLRGCSSYFGNLDANTSVFLHWYKGVHIPILGCIRSSNIHDLESGGLPSSSPLYDISLAPLRQRIPLAIAAAHSGDDFR